MNYPTLKTKGTNRTQTMRFLPIVMFTVLGCLMQSCNNTEQTDLKNQNTEEFLSEMALSYWDLNYSFPESYLQSRDTGAWFFSQYMSTDSILLCHNSEITYTDQDTALLITYYDDTIALVKLPCSCDWTDEMPYGPRAYDSLNRMILDDLIPVSWHGEQVRLTYDIANNLFPAIEKKMNGKGYIRTNPENKEYPQYLLIKYLPENDSIELIKACQKYSCYFYDEYAKILQAVLSEYCRNNHVAKLLTPVDIYLPSAKDSMHKEEN